MARDIPLDQLVQDIGGMVEAAATHAPMEDVAVRRTLSFLSQVILVVEQAFQDVLTVLIEVQFLDKDSAQDGRLDEVRRRVALLTARSHYRDAAEICSRLKHLHENYDTKLPALPVHSLCFALAFQSPDRRKEMRRSQLR